MFYDLAAPSWGAEELGAMKRVIDSGFLTMSENVAAFEIAFADYLGLDHAVMVNSGSSANLLAVASLFFRQDRPLQRGDAVIVPAISWATTYHPLQQYGLKMSVVDVDLETLNVDVRQLEAALGPKTRMIVAVSILGNPAALDTMRDFAAKHDLYFMEDNCESLDAELNGQKAGTFGLVNTSSFFFSHHISTIEGGMVATNDTEACHLVRSLRAHGWTRDLPPDSPVFVKRDDDFYEAYRFILPGYNVRPLELSGALFQELLGNDERFIIQRENGKSSAFSFPIVLNPAHNPDRENVFRALEKADIGYRIITGGNILRHDVRRFYDYEAVDDLANANTAHDLGFFVGNHPQDLSQQLNRLAEVLDATC